MPAPPRRRRPGGDSQAALPLSLSHLRLRACAYFTFCISLHLRCWFLSFFVLTPFNSFQNDQQLNCPAELPGRRWSRLCSGVSEAGSSVLPPRGLLPGSPRGRTNALSSRPRARQRPRGTVPGLLRHLWLGRDGLALIFLGDLEGLMKPSWASRLSQHLGPCSHVALGTRVQTNCVCHACAYPSP